MSLEEGRRRLELVRSLWGGPLGQFLAGKTVGYVNEGFDADGPEPESKTADVLISCRRLQDIEDYRLSLQTWFERVRPGGYLIVVVPHAFLYERKLSLPSPWRSQRRLYTPGSLGQEIEEALVPNTYRIRWLGDLDQGYDYSLPPDFEPEGASEAAIVLEKISAPAWSVGCDLVSAKPPETLDFEFEPPRTRVELNTFSHVRRILALKLDHAGDLILALPALERLRGYFTDAEITLVVGSWNARAARELGVADRVIAFDAFPRNSTEEMANVEATVGQFRSMMVEDYDLAVDLRTDIDTRTLLKEVKAEIRAGIGTRAQFPFLDIALPLDSSRNEAERAQEDLIPPTSFLSQGSAGRSPFAIHSDPATVERHCAIVWGPYFELKPGDYIFDFYLELGPADGDGRLKLDIAIDEGRTITEMIVSRPTKYHLPFRIEKNRTVFEARISVFEDRPSLGFSFYGGRLIRHGAESVLHQSEYSTLLVELLNLRMQEIGLLRGVGLA